MRCWGIPQYGQLGRGTTFGTYTGFQYPSAAMVAANLGTGFRVAVLSMGQYHACAISLQGSVKCWGANSSGQLGDASFTQRLTATPVRL